MTHDRHVGPPSVVPTVPTWLDPLPSIDVAGEAPSAPAVWSDREGHLRRLRGIERQVRGLQRMIDHDVHPIDVVTQVAAVARALQSVALGLFDEHFRTWFANAADPHDQRAGDVIDEATRAIESLLRP